MFNKAAAKKAAAAKAAQKARAKVAKGFLAQCKKIRNKGKQMACLKAAKASSKQGAIASAQARINILKGNFATSSQTLKAMKARLAAMRNQVKAAAKRNQQLAARMKKAMGLLKKAGGKPQPLPMLKK